MIQGNIEILLDHPHGKQWVPLDAWICEGPGGRDLLRPSAARLAGSEQSLPLGVVPLRYRNSSLSRLLISVGLLQNPWKSHD